MTAERAIDRNQIKIIKIAQKQLGIEEPEYRAMLRQYFEVSSCTELTHRQADTLIKEFEQRGFVRTGAPRPQFYGRKRPRAHNLVDLPSPQIMAKIAHLAKDVRWDYQDGYERWVMKKYHVARPRTMHEAIMIVEGLKAMRARQNIARIEAAKAPAMKEPF